MGCLPRKRQGSSILRFGVVTTKIGGTWSFVMREHARSFFNLYDAMVALDEEGKEPPMVDAARREAARNARYMACADVLEGHLGVATRLFKDVVKLHPQAASQAAGTCHTRRCCPHPA